MAEVWEAVNSLNGRTVALKVVHGSVANDAEFMAALYDEFSVSNRLKHPHIIAVHQMKRTEEFAGLEMEYFDGRDLRKLLNAGMQASAAPSVEAVVDLGVQLASALDYAHRAADSKGRPLGLIHRDISPHNILVARTGEAKVLDFGIALARDRVTRTEVGKVKGKLCYMAPEQLAGLELDVRSDLFSFGIVLWETLSVRQLFKRERDEHTIQAIATGDVPPITSINPAVPADLAELVHTLLAVASKDRPPNALVVLETLSSLPRSREALARWVEQVDPAKKEATKALPALAASRPSEQAKNGAIPFRSSVAAPKPSSSGPEVPAPPPRPPSPAARPSAPAGRVASRPQPVASGREPDAPRLPTSALRVVDDQFIATSRSGARFEDGQEFVPSHPSIEAPEPTVFDPQAFDARASLSGPGDEHPSHPDHGDHTDPAPIPDQAAIAASREQQDGHLPTELVALPTLQDLRHLRIGDGGSTHVILDRSPSANGAQTTTAVPAPTVATPHPRVASQPTDYPPEPRTQLDSESPAAAPTALALPQVTPPVSPQSAPPSPPNTHNWHLPDRAPSTIPPDPTPVLPRTARVQPPPEAPPLFQHPGFLALLAVALGLAGLLGWFISRAES